MNLSQRDSCPCWFSHVIRRSLHYAELARLFLNIAKILNCEKRVILSNKKKTTEEFLRFYPQVIVLVSYIVKRFFEERDLCNELNTKHQDNETDELSAKYRDNGGYFGNFTPTLYFILISILL